METKVMRSAIKTYPIIFWILTHDSTLLSNKARIFVCSNPFVVNMAGVEQGNVGNEEFMEDVARSECVYRRNSKDFALLISPEEVLYVGNTKFSDQWVEGSKFLSLQEYSASPKPIFSTILKLTMTSLRTKRWNKFACSKIFSLDFRHVVCCDFPPAQRTCNFLVFLIVDSFFYVNIYPIWSQTNICPETPRNYL